MKQHDGNIAGGGQPPPVPSASAAPSAAPVDSPAAASPTTTTAWVEPALPETYGVDEVGVLCKDPSWYFVYWEVTEAGLEAARTQLGLTGGAEDQARLVLRVLPAAGERRGRDGRDIRDIPVDLHVRHGRRYLEAPRQNPVFRVAIGLLGADGLFAPIAHSPTVRTPPHQASGETSIEWLHVLPSRGDGRARERIVAASQKHSERIVPARGSDSATSGAGTSERHDLGFSLGGSSGLTPASPPNPEGRPEGRGDRG